jgi:hypothetical protein
MSLSEKATRKQLIDKALLSSGWEPILRAGSERQRALVALEEFPTDNGPADYTLFYRERTLAIVEVKKLGAGVSRLVGIVSPINQRRRRISDNLCGVLHRLIGAMPSIGENNHESRGYNR